MRARGTTGDAGARTVFANDLSRILSATRMSITMNPLQDGTQPDQLMSREIQRLVPRGAKEGLPR